MGKPFTFISYARADGEFVLRLAAELRAKGVSLWLDKFDIKPGADWGRSVDAALEACETFLIILSPASVASDNVLDELTTALDDKKRIVPLLYQACRIPLRLRRLHYIDFTVSYETGKESLFTALEVEEIAIESHTPAPVVEKPVAPQPEPVKPMQERKVEKVTELARWLDVNPVIWPQAENFSEQLPGNVSLEMVAIPGGSFMMGSKTYRDSQPIHQVTLQPFYLGKYQVTQAQWKAVMSSNPSKFKGDDLPVEKVSWDDAQEFCNKLSEMTGRQYRLPSEAEWEYAARAGSTGDFCFGDNENLLDKYAWYDKNSDSKTHPVGQKKPNAWGLYDVHGNVWEWCEDVWHDSYKGAPVDGSAWVSGGNQDRRLLRGGAWFYGSDRARAVSRYDYSPGSRDDDSGFRLVVARPPSSS